MCSAIDRHQRLALPGALLRSAPDGCSEYAHASIDADGQTLGIDAREQCCRDRHLSFDTQNRFIETRYREDPNLKSE